MTHLEKERAFYAATEGRDKAYATYQTPLARLRWPFAYLQRHHPKHALVKQFIEKYLSGDAKRQIKGYLTRLDNLKVP
ncbi:hypothetical protein [Acanthopleuribacter pedis]|uniref:Uncharacterized protein n=1 Tax=Acanthopleuribacter pedis TaxID=442870 RepID=A0A8J7U7H9_9BACT|nr:hypothetical protein [Acanthopleuribacter pedis]MBO1321426.1 hypothetical protein [Acanthopleuribacter pedis]